MPWDGFPISNGHVEHRLRYADARLRQHNFISIATFPRGHIVNCTPNTNIQRARHHKAHMTVIVTFCCISSPSVIQGLNLPRCGCNDA